MKRSRIKPISKKRQQEGSEYARLAKQFLADNPRCAVCGRPSEQVHHKARRGAFYLRTDTWLALCAPCHHRVESNGEWAKEHGYTLTPEQRRNLS